MALSGSATKAIGSHWFLDLDWSATQSIATNKSTITVNLYWRCDSYGSVSSSDTKNGSITIGSYTDTFSGAGLASLSAGQKKKIATFTQAVSHANDGTLSVSISGMFDMDVTLSGTRYNNQTVSDGTQTLNTIPRGSTITSSASWTFPNNTTYTIDENSSSFTHKIEVLVNGVVKKTISNITGTIGNITFSASENASILTELNKDTTSWNQASIIRLYTYRTSTQDSANLIDTYDKTGTCTSATATTLTARSFDIGTTVTYDLTNEKSGAFVYDLTAKLGTYTKTLMTKVDASTLTGLSWNTSSDKTSLMGGLPTANSGAVTWTLTTYFNNGGSYTKVRSAVTATSTATIPTGADRTITWADSPCVTWADINGATSGIGGSTTVVQNKSTLEITLKTLATAPTGTTIKQYEVNILGTTDTLTLANASVNAKFPIPFVGSKLNTPTDIIMEVKAIDNRGNFVSYKKTVTVVPYASPVLVSKVTRQSGFDNLTDIKLTTANIALLNVSGSNKNSVVFTADPTVAPTLSQTANAGSTLVAGTYYVVYTWVNSMGETLVSPQSSFAVTTGNNLVVTVPTKPTTATNVNVYISTTNGVGYLQGSIPTGTTYTRSTAIVTNTAQRPTVYTASGLRYRTRVTGTTTYSAYTSIKFSMSGANITVASTDSPTISLDNTKSWDIEVSIVDVLETVTSVKIVTPGIPIFFIDSNLKSVGIGKFPNGTNMLELENKVWIAKANPQTTQGDYFITADTSPDGNAVGNGRTYIGYNQATTGQPIAYGHYFRGGGKTYFDTKGGVQLNYGMNINFNNGGTTTPDFASGYYGLHMKNQDIRGLNAIVFQDETDNASEGILFPKAGVSDSLSLSDYYALQCINGDLNFSGKHVLTETNVIIQTGTVSVTAGSGSTSNVAVTFPKAFPSTPSIQVTPNTGAPDLVSVSFSNPSASGFTAQMNRTGTSTATTLYWVAIWGNS